MDTKRPVDLGPMFWFCESCHCEGPADFPAATTVREAVDHLRKSHDQASPTCGSNTRTLRVLDGMSLQKLKTRIGPQ